MAPFIIFNICILIIIINITYFIRALSKRKYKLLLYFPLPFIFIFLSMRMDLPARLGVYGKIATIEFIRVRPAVADDKIKASSYEENDAVIEFFSDMKLIDIDGGPKFFIKKNVLDKDRRFSDWIYFKEMQDNRYVYCALFSYNSLQEKLPTDIVCYIRVVAMLVHGLSSDYMTMPSKYLIKDTTIVNKPNEIL